MSALELAAEYLSATRLYVAWAKSMDPSKDFSAGRS